VAEDDEAVPAHEEGDEELGAGPIPALAKTKINKRWLVRRELKKLPEVLENGEQVVNLARGEYEGREGLTAVTDRRVLFLEQGVVRHRFEDFRYDRINSVQTSTGLRAGKLTVFVAGHKHEITDVRPKQRAVEIGDYVRTRAGERPAEAAPTPESAAPPDAMDQLRKLAELRDAGVLTPEEFEAKKTELLSRM
jgi:hypothetical protein